MAALSIKDFPLENVRLLDDYYINAFEKETDYLLSIDTDRILAGFRETAGLDMKGKKRYAGWEDSLIGGHTLGHYLTACVQAYESAKAGNSSEEQQKAFLEKIKTITEGLRECQDAVGTGFIFGATLCDKNNIEKQFDNVEKNMTDIKTQSWVPWYTMHKIIEGLVAVACMKDECKAVTGQDRETETEIFSVAQTALSVVSRLGDWVYKRACCVSGGWNEDVRKTVLSTEYGGMNDCMYDVYLLTGKAEHMAAAHCFDEETLFERILLSKPGENVLDNVHANTTIPKFLGALKRFIITGEQIYFDYAYKFWETVVNCHTYITGDNSEWEHFGKDMILDMERTNCNCETCNAYNMLKMTRLFFMITGDVKYADWYENTFINSILSSQNPKTGMTTYFQPMAGGYFKVYSTRFTKFWCCTGSGMENFTKLGGSIYFYGGDTLFVNRYVSSELKCKWKGNDISITQKTKTPVSPVAEFVINGDFTGNMALRIPDWVSEKPVVTLNGKPYEYEAKTGYAVIKFLPDKTGKTGISESDGIVASAVNVIKMTLPAKVTAHNLPDGENTYAFKYGPIVLCALLGDKDMKESETGVNVTIPEKSIFENKYTAEEETVTVNGTVKDFIDNINDYMVRDENSDALKFKLTNVKDANLVYVPHYSQHKERFGLYFKFKDGGNGGVCL